jgi:hypothetical protein
MEYTFSYLTISESINFLLEKLAVSVFWAWLALTIIRYTRKNITKEGFGKGLYLGGAACLEAAVLVFLIYAPLPQSLVLLSHNMLELVTVRWILLYLIAILWSYRVSYKTSGRRGMRFVILILTTLFFGWLYDRWLGIFSMSVPVLLIYFFFISKVAHVILPASNPEDKLEARKKTRAFIMYLLGVQHPILMAESKTGRKFEKQLDGNGTNEIGKPGMIWTWSHQVAGISKGVGSNRVDGPGLIFTEPYESPIALVDLRMQSRVSVVNTVTKDGLEIPTIVFAAFVVDKGNASISRPSRHRYTANGGNFNIDHAEGSFPYSSGRILATLSKTGINNPRRGEIEEKPDLFWDEWVVKQIEHATRLVVAERSLDQLWRPKNDDLGASALTEIATRLQSLLAPQLTEVGINLITVRIVNYELSEKPEIVQQNLKVWSSYWEQQIVEANADREMIYREEIEKAHAYSKSMLLSAIAESIAKARSINEALPRHVIAQYFIHALEEYMKGQPGVNMAESKKHLDTVKEILMYNRLEGSE